MIEYIRSLKWIDYYYFCILDPRRLVNLIARKEGKPFFQGLIIVMIAAFFEIISLSMLGSESGFFYYKVSYGWILVLLIIFLKIVLFSALVDLFSQLKKHQGKITLIINLINFSFFPVVFLLPMVIIFTTFNFAPIFFYILFFVLVHLWQAMIIIQGISEIHQTGFGEALVIFLLPTVFVGLTLFFAMILFFINFAGFISFI